MVTLDTTKFSLPFDAVDGIDTAHPEWEIEKKTKGGKVIVDRSTIRSIDHGLSAIEVNRLTGSVTISSSAKILKDNYRRGISLDTIEQYYSAIKSTGLIEVSIDNLLNESSCRIIDNTSNIDVRDIRRSVNNVINHASINSKYHIDHYRGTGAGYVAQRKVQSYKERQIGYSKYDELNTAKLESFCRDCPAAVKSFSKNTLRVESNYTSHKRMRQAFRVMNNSLGAILNSAENPNLTVFERIVEKGRQLDLFSSLYDGMSLPEIRNEIGYIGIFQRFNNDLSLVESWIRNEFERKTHSYYYKLVREAYSKIESQSLQTEHKYIEEIISLLKSAA